MGTVLASLSIDLGSTRLQRLRTSTARAKQILGSAHPNQHSLVEKDRAGKRGDFLARCREGTFRTPCVRLVLDRRCNRPVCHVHGLPPTASPSSPPPSFPPLARHNWLSQQAISFGFAQPHISPALHTPQLLHNTGALPARPLAARPRPQPSGPSQFFHPSATTG
jgi:hypothetical protein